MPIQVDSNRTAHRGMRFGGKRTLQIWLCLSVPLADTDGPQITDELSGAFRACLTYPSHDGILPHCLFASRLLL
jgi:hypothetical protein